MLYSQESIGGEEELRLHGIHAITAHKPMRRVKVPSGFVEHGEGEGDVQDQIECMMEHVNQALSERI